MDKEFMEKVMAQLAQQSATLERVVEQVDKLESWAAEGQEGAAEDYAQGDEYNQDLSGYENEPWFCGSKEVDEVQVVENPPRTLSPLGERFLRLKSGPPKPKRRVEVQFEGDRVKTRCWEEDPNQSGGDMGGPSSGQVGGQVPITDKGKNKTPFSRLAGLEMGVPSTWLNERAREIERGAGGSGLPPIPPVSGPLPGPPSGDPPNMGNAVISIPGPGGVNSNITLDVSGLLGMKKGDKELTKHIRMPTLEGAPDDDKLCKFIKDVDRYIESHNPADQRTFLNVLLHAQKGGVYDLLNGFIDTAPTPPTWDEIQKVLMDMYASEDPRGDSLKKLFSCYLEEGRLSDHIIKFSHLVYKMSSHPMAEKDYIRQFIKSLKHNPEVQGKLERTPGYDQWDSLENLLTTAKKFGAKVVHKKDKSDPKKPKVDDRPFNPRGRGRGFFDMGRGRGFFDKGRGDFHKGFDGGSRFPFRGRGRGRGGRGPWGRGDFQSSPSTGPKEKFKVILSDAAKEMYAKEQLCINCGEKNCRIRDCKKNAALSSMLSDKSGCKIIRRYEEDPIEINSLSVSESPKKGDKSSPNPAEKLNQEWQIRSHVLDKIQSMIPTPFTFEACTNVEGTNRVLPHCKRAHPEDSFVGKRLQGECIWMNPPYSEIKSFLQHYNKEKALSPGDTSCVVILPFWASLSHAAKLQGWVRLTVYPKKFHLFQNSGSDKKSPALLYPTEV